MKNAILLHGKPKREKFQDLSQPRPGVDHYHQWTADQFAKRGITTYMPTLPRPYDPNYEDCAAFITAMPINPESIVVGRSMGAGLMLRIMTERQDMVLSKMILVAPWLDPLKNYGKLFNFQIDPTILERVTNGVTVFYSSKDDDQALASLDIIKEAFPDVKYRDIPEYGHYMIGNTMKNKEFPELFEELDLAT
jgi:pimeloyl-ACP methyl ester carboxylesterase